MNATGVLIGSLLVGIPWAISQEQGQDAHLAVADVPLSCADANVQSPRGDAETTTLSLPA